MGNEIIIYLGFNNPKKYKRGVENVIHLQSLSVPDKKCFYIFFDDEDAVFKWDHLICIAIRNQKLKFVVLNAIVKKLERKYKLPVFIHAHSYLLSFFLTRATNVFTVHDGLYYLNKAIGKKMLSAFRLIEKLVYAKSSKVHFVSAYAKSMACYKGENYVIIHNTTAISKANAMPLNNTSTLPKKLFIVRSIEERVGFDLIVEFAHSLKEKYGDAYKIEIAGKGPLLSNYQSIIEKKGYKNIAFLGYISDDELAKKYTECFAVLVPAKYGEGFGLPVIEAYAFNKPVLASDVCAIPEVILDKKYLFENNLESLQNVFDFFLQNPNTDKRYINYYENNFSEELIKKKYRQLLYNEEAF